MMGAMAPEATASGPLVGRATELGRLSSLVGVASGEPPGAVLLAGDAGVGKTRLLAELRDQARAAGWRVLVGHCFDFGDSAQPYLPFSEVFGRLADEAPQLAASLVDSYPQIARLMPGRRVLTGADDVPATGMQRSDLFEVVRAALDELSREGPLLVVIEDVHWADQSTREMLSFLFTRRFAERVAIVASYRSDDLHRRHPLRAAAAEWARVPGVSRIQLMPLADADIRALVLALHPAPLREMDVRRIVERAEGNAFFTEELVAASGLDGGALPTDLADLLLLRIDQLDDTARLTIRAASVAGRRVSHALLARVAGIDDGALERAIRAAVEGNVLVTVGAAGYAFRHALLAEAVYDDLLPGERVRLHGVYASAFAARDVEGTAAELARHARLANDLPTAMRASIQAGDEAMSLAGPDEAAHHYETALELLTDSETVSAGAGDIDVIDLVIRASMATNAAGHPYRAVALVQDQLDVLPRDADPRDRARLLVAYAQAAFMTDSPLDVLTATTEALSLVPAQSADALRARVLAVHARSNADHYRDDEAARWAGDALELAHKLELLDVTADAATTLARIEERAGDPEVSKRALEQAVEEARRASAPGAELRSMSSIGGLHYELGRLDEAFTAFEAAAARAREMGRPWAPYGVDARILAGQVAYVKGDWDAALRTVDVSGESPPGLAEAGLAAVGVAVAAGRGDARALDLLPVLRPWWQREGLVAITSGTAAIDLYGDFGDLEAAQRVHDDVVQCVSELWELHNFQARIRMSGILLGQLGAEAARSGAKERADLARRGDELRDAARAAEPGRVRGKKRGPEGEAWLARVAAEHARLRWLTGVDAPDEKELVAAWERAVLGFEVYGHAFELARSRARLAAVLKAVGRSDEAATLISLVRATARRLDAQPLLAELQLLTGASPATPSRLTEALTAREHEVLLLVAQGKSNREIGTQLYISGKTVSVHVSNILAKLGATSRTEAVALARRRGLLTEEGASR